MENWLPDMDLNHDKQIQSLLCYRYTIGQGNFVKIMILSMESRNCRAFGGRQATDSHIRENQ